MIKRQLSAVDLLLRREKIDLSDDRSFKLACRDESIRPPNVVVVHIVLAIRAVRKWVITMDRALNWSHRHGRWRFALA